MLSVVCFRHSYDINLVDRMIFRNVGKLNAYTKTHTHTHNMMFWCPSLVRQIKSHHKAFCVHIVLMSITNSHIEIQMNKLSRIFHISNIYNRDLLDKCFVRLCVVCNFPRFYYKKSLYGNAGSSQFYIKTTCVMCGYKNIYITRTQNGKGKKLYWYVQNMWTKNVHKARMTIIYANVIIYFSHRGKLIAIFLARSQVKLTKGQSEFYGIKN